MKLIQKLFDYEQCNDGGDYTLIFDNVTLKAGLGPLHAGTKFATAHVSLSEDREDDVYIVQLSLNIESVKGWCS